MYFHKPQEKPRKWGSSQDIQYAIRANASKIGLPIPAFVTIGWEKAGNIAYDLINRQNLAFGSGAAKPTWGAEYITFSSAVQYLTITDPAQLIFPDTSFSIVVRFRCSQSGLQQYIVNKNYGGAGVKWWGAQIHNTGAFGLLLDDGTTYGSVQGNTTGLDDGTWHTGVAIRNREEDKRHVYVDGEVDIDPAPDGFGTVDSGTGLFWIGGRTDGNVDRDFAGDIAFVKIFPSALTAEQVAIDYSHPYGLCRPIARPVYFFQAAAGLSIPVAMQNMRGGFNPIGTRGGFINAD